MVEQPRMSHDGNFAQYRRTSTSLSQQVPNLSPQKGSIPVHDNRSYTAFLEDGDSTMVTNTQENQRRADDEPWLDEDTT